MEAVYTQIKEDLSVVDNALFLITPSKTDVDKAVAATYLAKVYAHRQEWGQVLTYSRMVLNSGLFYLLLLLLSCKQASGIWESLLGSGDMMLLRRILLNGVRFMRTWIIPLP